MMGYCRVRVQFGDLRLHSFDCLGLVSPLLLVFVNLFLDFFVHPQCCGLCTYFVRVNSRLFRYNPLEYDIR
jgi:hypothetical protein